MPCRGGSVSNIAARIHFFPSIHFYACVRGSPRSQISISENFRTTTMNIEQLTNASVSFYGPAIEEEIKSIYSRVDALDESTKYAWLEEAIGFIHLPTLGANVPGMTPLQTRVREVEKAVELGADEINRLINTPLTGARNFPLLYELVKLKCAVDIQFKLIRATGELGSLKNIYRAALMAMLAGANFIKTSTGKLMVNATLPMGIAMCRAIKDYYKHTGRKVGLKLDRGIITPQDALDWMFLVEMELGKEWLTKDLFKFGDPNLLDNIITEMNSD